MYSLKNKFFILSLVLLIVLILCSCRDSRSSNRRDKQEFREKDTIEESNIGGGGHFSITSEPDEQKIKKDLSGRTIVEPTHKLYRSEFKILSAKDGEEALRKATEQIPDLIISDIMMPVMDGLELLKMLRKNEYTNHIPVILLTAKSTESSVLAGYKTGADDYIVKPFSEEILKTRIENILSSRKKMWEQYKQSKDMDEYKEKLSESPQKQAFVKKINEIIIEHIADPFFGIETLANELKMSLNQLFRKMKALMDATPYSIILQVRMTRAVQLIKEGNLNISEIAFAVGYQELSNFSRTFKKYYNLSPRDYEKKMKSCF